MRANRSAPASRADRLGDESNRRGRASGRAERRSIVSVKSAPGRNSMLNRTSKKVPCAVPTERSRFRFVSDADHTVPRAPSIPPASLLAWSNHRRRHIRALDHKWRAIARRTAAGGSRRYVTASVGRRARTAKVRRFCFPRGVRSTTTRPGNRAPRPPRCRREENRFGPAPRTIPTSFAGRSAPPRSCQGSAGQPRENGSTIAWSSSAGRLPGAQTVSFGDRPRPPVFGETARAGCIPMRFRTTPGKWVERAPQRIAHWPQNPKRAGRPRPGVVRYARGPT